MSDVDLWNVLVLIGGAWLVASCVAMVALVSIQHAERRKAAQYPLDQSQSDAEGNRLVPPTADRLRSVPGTGDRPPGHVATERESDPANSTQTSSGSSPKGGKRTGPQAAPASVGTSSAGRRG